MARRVRFFSTQIEKEKDAVPVRPLYDSALMITVGPRGPQTIDELDVQLSAHEKRLLQMNESYETLSERLRELVEAKHVLRETAVFFQQVCICDAARLKKSKKSLETDGGMLLGCRTTIGNSDLV